MNTGKDTRFDWRIGYAAFCLLYAAWVIYLGLDNFDKVHSEYRWASEQLQPARIRETALQELAEQCRREARKDSKRSDRYRKGAGMLSAAEEDACLSWPEAELTKQEKKVGERLDEKAGRLKRKLIVFYITFASIFLVLPMVFLYLLLAFLVWLFRGVKIIR